MRKDDKRWWADFVRSKCGAGNNNKNKLRLLLAIGVYFL
jgi:hypothetical protein